LEMPYLLQGDEKEISCTLEDTWYQVMGAI